jgi:hypothetical protein
MMRAEAFQAKALIFTAIFERATLNNASRFRDALRVGIVQTCPRTDGEPVITIVER